MTRNIETKHVVLDGSKNMKNSLGKVCKASCQLSGICKRDTAMPSHLGLKSVYPFEVFFFESLNYGLSIAIEVIVGIK